jgi:methylglutaconyl-CoA hydratase
MSVKTEIKDHIAKVTLARPEIHNAFNAEMISKLTNIFQDLSSDKKLRAVVLSAEGKSFCAGGDLNWMKSTLNFSYEENINDAKKLADMFMAIYKCSIPVIGRIQGTAIGGGVGLVSVCDMACAVESAKFALSEVRIGLLPAVISPFVLRKLIPGEARRYFLTSERFDANEARRIGLISEVTKTPEEMDLKINGWIESILGGGPEAIKICKQMMGEIPFMGLDKALEITSKQIAERRVSKEGQEGMLAFLEKRNPKW